MTQRFVGHTMYVDALSVSGNMFRCEIFTRRGVDVGSGPRPDVVLIGELRWHKTWEEFVFFPEPDTYWTKACLNDVCNAIQWVEALRKHAEGGGNEDHG